MPYPTFPSFHLVLASLFINHCSSHLLLYIRKLFVTIFQYITYNKYIYHEISLVQKKISIRDSANHNVAERSRLSWTHYCLVGSHGFPAQMKMTSFHHAKDYRAATQKGNIILLGTKTVKRYHFIAIPRHTLYLLWRLFSFSTFCLAFQLPLLRIAS